MSNQRRKLLVPDVEELSPEREAIDYLKSLRDSIQEKKEWNGRGEKRPARSLLEVDSDEVNEVIGFLDGARVKSRVTIEVVGHGLTRVFDDAIRELELKERANTNSDTTTNHEGIIAEMQAQNQALQAQMMQMMQMMVMSSGSVQAAPPQQVVQQPVEEVKLKPTPVKKVTGKRLKKAPEPENTGS